MPSVTECESIGVAVNIHETSGDVRVLIALHETEGNEEATAWALIPPEAAVNIAMALIARAGEAANLRTEIAGTEGQQKAAKIRSIFRRLHSPLN
jgi:hypothetical protein